MLQSQTREEFCSLAAQCKALESNPADVLRRDVHWYLDDPSVQRQLATDQL